MFSSSSNRRRKVAAVGLSALLTFGVIGVASSAHAGAAGCAGSGRSANEIKTKLNHAGVQSFRTGANVNNACGPKTREAVMEFQRRNGLKVDGIVGPETWNGLNGKFEKSAADRYQEKQRAKATSNRSTSRDR